MTELNAAAAPLDAVKAFAEFRGRRGEGIEQ